MGLDDSKDANMLNAKVIVAPVVVLLVLGQPTFAQEASVNAASSTPTEQPTGTDRGADVDITAEQAAQVRELVAAADIDAVDVDFNVSIGETIPTTVTLSLVPLSVVSVIPQFEGYLLFVLTDGRIAIVSPTTLKIVLVV